MGGSPGRSRPVDLHQGLVRILEVVARERLVQRAVRLARHHREQLEGGHPAAHDLGQERGGDLLVRLDQDLAGLRVHHPPAGPAAHQRLRLDRDLGDAGLDELLDDLRVQGLARLDDRFLGAGRLDVVADLGPVVDLGGELHPGHPVLEGEHLLRLVELAEDLLVGEDHALLEEPERAQERGGEHLAPPVHPHVEDVVGVELELHPRAAVGDHPGREQQLARGDRLALVVVEEHARGALELRDHHPLGAVDDEGALLGHERQLAEIHLLLPHLAHGLGLGFLVVVDDLEPQRHLQGDREGHAPVVALLDRVLGIAEVVAVELEHGVPVVVLDREHRLEDRLQSRLVAPLGRDLLLEKLLVGLLLDLDEIRNLDDGRDLAEVLADPAPALDVVRHTPSAPRLPQGWVRPAAVTHSGESGAAPSGDTLVSTGNRHRFPGLSHSAAEVI